VKTIVKRLCRLEERLVPAIDHESFRLANMIRDRRRRRLEASGQPFEDMPYLAPTPGPYRSYADTLRSLRQERLSRTSPPGGRQ
jgi:hypothetical protein